MPVLWSILEFWGELSASRAEPCKLCTVAHHPVRLLHSPPLIRPDFPPLGVGMAYALSKVQAVMEPLASSVVEQNEAKQTVWRVRQ